MTLPLSVQVFQPLPLHFNCCESFPSNSTIAVVGDDPGFGRGTAYRSEFHIHRLNVAAQRMSISPMRPMIF